MAGKAGFAGDEDEVIADINIIPFVDIVLVLLIIFMVTSTAIVRNALKVDLPQAASAGEAVQSTLNIIYTAAGELMLDGAQLSRAQLQESIAAAARDNSKLQAVISADKGVAYGDVVGIIDLVKRAGVLTFALNIERTAASDASN